MVDEIDAFMCPITGEVLLDPVLAADGHTYSRAAIADWLGRHQTSPLTGAPLPSAQLLPNYGMRKAIEETRDRQPLAIDHRRLQIHEDQVLGGGSHLELGRDQQARRCQRVELARRQQLLQHNARRGPVW